MAAEGSGSVEALFERYLEKHAIWIVALVALVLRLSYLIEASRSPLFDLFQVDAEYYDDKSREILSGNWLARPGVFTMSPLYPYFLAAVYGVSGASVFFAKLVQQLVGVGSCVLIYVAGPPAGGPRARIPVRNAGSDLRPVRLRRGNARERVPGDLLQHGRAGCAAPRNPRRWGPVVAVGRTLPRSVLGHPTQRRSVADPRPALARPGDSRLPPSHAPSGGVPAGGVPTARGHRGPQSGGVGRVGLDDLDRWAARLCRHARRRRGLRIARFRAAGRRHRARGLPGTDGGGPREEGACVGGLRLLDPRRAGQDRRQSRRLHEARGQEAAGVLRGRRAPGQLRLSLRASFQPGTGLAAGRVLDRPPAGTRRSGVRRPGRAGAGCFRTG